MIKAGGSRGGKRGVSSGMIGTSTEPLTVTISHRLGREEAKRRIERGLGTIRTEAAPYVRRLDYHWAGDYRLEFEVSAMMQTITARIEIEDQAIRVELGLPRLLHMLAKIIAGHVERSGHALLEGPKSKA